MAPTDATSSQADVMIDDETTVAQKAMTETEVNKD